MPQNPDASTPYDEFEPPAPPRQGFGRFIRDVIIVLALGAGALFLYKQRVDTRQEVEELRSQAQRLVKRNDLASLLEAQKVFEEALALTPSDGRLSAALAETLVFQHATHGLDTLDEASRQLSEAERQEVESPARFASAAYLDILKGQPESAERKLKALLDDGKGASSLAHALGWARLEQGDLYDGNRLMNTAADGDFSALGFRMTLADGTLRQGLPKAAIKHLSNITAPNMNPNHHLAKAYLAALRLQTSGNLTGPSKLMDDLEQVIDEVNQSPRAKAYLEWAKAERALAVGAANDALSHIEEAKKAWPDHPPFFGVEARALKTKGDLDGAVAAYEKAIALRPLYRGLKWELARLKSERKDDAALTLVAELEKAQQGVIGPEFEIFRGKHALEKGDLKEAKAHFTQAAELGNDPEILLGLARVAFAEETPKGKKADLEKVAEPLERAMDAQKFFPEAQEFYGDVNLWNYLADGAQAAYEEAEKHLKRLRKPVPEVLAFYSRVIARLNGVTDAKLKRQTSKLAEDWEKRRDQYIASLLTENS